MDERFLGKIAKAEFGTNSDRPLFKIPKNPNKRPCVARNITFPVQKENQESLRKLKS